MALISVPNIADGTVIDANDVNSPINTIVNEFNGNIDQANLADNSVGTTELQSNAVTTAKIADSSVTLAKISNPVRFSAYPFVNQTSVATTWSKLACNTEEYDIGSNYNSSTYVFTAPTTGYYSFTVSCLFSAPAGTAVLIGIGKNWTSGSETKRLGEIPNCSGNVTLSGSCDIYLTAGDTVCPLYYTTAAGIILLGGSIYMRFTGKLESL